LPLLVLVFAQWAGAEDRAFNSGSVKICYVEEGNGDPVVLVHGFSRNSEVNWIETGIMEAQLDYGFYILVG